jgi:alpha-tubulin suppressor-like RCC1 family protein
MNLKGKMLIQLWKSSKAAIDLASIMVGVIVVGLIGGIIAATVFAVIPWAQDNSAKASLDSVKQAQNVYAGLSADPDNKSVSLSGATSSTVAAGSVTFAADVDTLIKKGLLSEGKVKSLTVSAGQSLECYIAAIKSDSGKVFWASDKLPAREYKTGDENKANCGNLVSLVDGLIDKPEASPVTPTTASCSLGNQTSYCFDVEGKLYASGKNQNNQISGTAPISSVAFTEVVVPKDVTFTKIKTNSDLGNTAVVTTYALDSTGRIWSWGGSAKNAPAVLNENQKFVDFNVSAINVVALDDKGAVWINGSNSWNQFGLDYLITDNTQKFVPVKGAPANIKKVQVANQTVMVLDSAGTVWAWGNPTNIHPNSSGERTLKPTTVDIPAKITNLSLASSHALALDENGKIWTWGKNTNSQLGNGSVVSSTTPAMIVPEKTFKAISTSSGSQSSYAITSDDTLHAWGYNYYGQLGNGTTSNVSTPTPLMADKKFASVEGTFYAASATTESKEIYAWGRNDAGQLGTGATGNVTAPVLVSLK